MFKTRTDINPLSTLSDQSLNGLLVSESDTLETGLKKALEEIGVTFRLVCVKDNEKLNLLLNKQPWDFLVADLDAPNFNLHRATSVIHSLNLDLPLIITGTEISQETAINSMKAGVHDYMQKNNLYRLAPVLERELRNARVRDFHKASVARTKIQNEILEKSINEIYMVNTEALTFSYANQTMLDNLGYEKDEFYTLHVSEILADKEQVEVDRIVKQLLTTSNEKVRLKVNRKRKDGSTYPAEIYLEKVNYRGKDYFLGISFDLTRQVQDAELIAEKERIEKELRLENKYKSDFLATLSHEMRTTLNSVALLSKILSDNRNDNLTSEQLEYLKVINTSNENLLEMLNEVLDFSKAESGALELNYQKLKMDEFFKRIERLFKPIAREKRLNLEYLSGIHEELEIGTDRLRIEQVINNLISNALKFTPEGSITLRSFIPSRKYLEDNNLERKHYVGLEVEDTGIGIPESKKEHIFSSYRQAEGGLTESEYGGTGLGLSISKKITEALKGQLFLRSIPGKGTTFTFLIPTGKELTLEDFENEYAASLSDDVNRDKVGRVLLVDDSKIHNMALREYLDFKVEECMTAETAEQAFEKLEDYAFDCIILDMYLPDADGKEVLHRLNKHPEFRDIPVIIYSGKNFSPEENKEILKLASGIIQKKGMSYKLLVEKIFSLVTGKTERENA